MDVKDLFEKYNKDIYRYAYSITLNVDEAKDAVSETFSKIIEKDLKHVENIKAYLVTTSRNIIYKKFAKESKLTNVDEVEQFPEFDSKSSEDAAIDSYLVDVIKKELNTLDASTREVILLKVWEDYKFSEIAEITNEKESTVKLRYYRGLEKLKEKVNSSTKLNSVTLPIVLLGLGKILSGLNYPKNSLMAVSAIKGISCFKAILATAGVCSILVISIFIAINVLNNNTIASEPPISTPVSSPVELREVTKYSLEIINGKDTNRNDQNYRALIYKTEAGEKEIYRWLQYPDFGIGGPNPCIEIKYNVDRSYFAVCQMSAEVLSNQQIPIVFDQFGEVVLDFSKVDNFPKDKLTSKTFGDTFFASSQLREFSWLDKTNLKLTFYNKTTATNEDSTYNIRNYKNLLTFTHNQLPGFSISYFEDWKVEIKEFKVQDTLGFESLYFQSCHEDCLGLRFSKDNVKVDVLFDMFFDESVSNCSDTINFTKLNTKWYRYDSLLNYSGNNTPKYIYSGSVYENIEQSGHLYKFCDSGASAASLIETRTKEDYFGALYDSSRAVLFGNVPRIMIEKPRVYSDNEISSEFLKEIDEMIISIKGIR